MRDIPQYNSIISTYDDELFYKLNPGTHKFSNLEFNTNFSINSFGARDDEESIFHPKIICVGDSFTLGWGVEQEEIFPSILEKMSGKKTLNLGVSSYGTAREFLFLNKINLDSCKALIIQFCENDALENRSFIKNNLNLIVSPEKKYYQAQRTNHLRKNYFPFKWVFEFFAKAVRSVTGQAHRKYKTKEWININEPIIMEDLFKIINLIQKKFSGKIFLFVPESSSENKENRVFPFMEKYLKNHPQKNVFLFDSSKFLTKEDFFTIDVHLNTQGHQKVAEGLLQTISK